MPYKTRWNRPEECDHEGGPDMLCTHCCPCDDCGAERAYDENEARQAAELGDECACDTVEERNG